jgi:hypothetical protein
LATIAPAIEKGRQQDRAGRWKAGPRQRAAAADSRRAMKRDSDFL